MSDETQDLLIKLITERLNANDKAHEKLFESMCTKKDIDRVIESNNRRIQMLAGVDGEARTDIDSHCVRIRELERQKAMQEVEFAPIKKLYDNFTSAMIGLMILMGTIFIGILYWFKERL